jgi:hypothetical protein
MKDLGNEMSPGNAIENGVVRLIAVATRLEISKVRKERYVERDNRKGCED